MIGAAELGILEGFYGRPYGWDEREGLLRTVSPAGYSFYLYAPKADAFFRERWRDPLDGPSLEALQRFAQVCRSQGVRFGVGLSPYELYLGFDTAAKAALAAKLAQLDQIGIDDLGIFFDDMKGDFPELAPRQIEICHWIAARSAASRLIVCPTYYNDEPTLDRIFGQRPATYLTELGAGLDPAIALMWTGPETCSREITPGHLDRVAETFRRKPFLWDNYPVNDGPIMSRHLHLRAFTGRPGAIASHLSGHAINTASQAYLSCIPALTLAESYRLGEAYDYGVAFRRASEEVLGADLAALVEKRLWRLDDSGLDGMDAARRARLKAEFDTFDHPAAREIVAWLAGA